MGNNNNNREQKKQRALELLVMISEDFIKLSFDKINYQRLVFYMKEISEAAYVAMNLVDQKEPSWQTTVAIAGDDVQEKKIAQILKIPNLVGYKWNIDDKLPEKKILQDRSESDGSVYSIVSVFESISRLVAIPVKTKDMMALEKNLDVGEVVLVRLMDESTVIGNFTLLMPVGKKFDQHYAVRIYARQLSQLLIRRNRENEIRRLMAENEIIFNSTQDSLALLRRQDDQKYIYVRVNEAFELMTGIKHNSLINKGPDSIFSPDKAAEMIRRLDDCTLAQVPITYELEAEVPNGNKVFQISLNPVCMDKEEYIVSSSKDVTEERSNQERVAYLSFHDQLTGLYNRHYFNHSLHRLDNARNLPLSVIMIDVNGLKLVNDAFGHSLGDQLLHFAGQTIAECSRADDIVCRIGGDEFVFLLPQTQAKDVETVVDRLHKAASKVKLGPFELSFSMGWSTRKEMGISVRELIQEAEEWMYQHKLVESPAMRLKVLQTIIGIMSNMPYEGKHGENTSRLCVQIARSLGWSDRRIEKIKKASLYHDIGKIAIPFEILNKKDTLSDREWSLIKRHAETGYRILASVSQQADVADLVLAHHERWDGNGYPRKIKGESIPLVSRIIHLADAFDAMTSERPYRAAKSIEQALIELKEESGKQFDPELVNLFLSERIYENPAI